MNREQMEAWCALEGWEPTDGGRFYHRGDNILFTPPSHMLDFGTDRGCFDAGDYYESWGNKHDDSFPKLLTELTKK